MGLCWLPVHRGLSRGGLRCALPSILGEGLECRPREPRAERANLSDLLDVGRLGIVGKVADLHVFNHALSSWSHDFSPWLCEVAAGAARA